MLVNMVFGLPDLEINKSHELQHVELFAGQCAVTRAEMQVGEITCAHLGKRIEDCFPIDGFQKKRHARGSEDTQATPPFCKKIEGCPLQSSTPKERRAAIAMDLEIGGPTMDLTTNEGFLAALYHTCRLKPGSGWLAAPVCSSFVFLPSRMFSNLSCLPTSTGSVTL